MILNTDRKLIFIHVPKCAGTSLASALAQDRSATRTPHEQALHASVTRKTQHETYAEYVAAFVERTGLPFSAIDDYAFVAFSRNPVARFCSLHRFLRVRHRVKYPLVPETLEMFARHVIEADPPYVQQIKSLRPQADFIEGAPADRLFLGKVETIYEDFDRLRQRFDLSVPLERLNTSTQDAQVPDVPPNVRTAIQRIYHADYVRFEYPV